MSITVKTRLHDSIYRSQDGGVVKTVCELNTGPRNLIKAISAYHEEVETNKRCYGSIGAGATWLEIDGVEINYMDLPQKYDDAEMTIIMGSQTSQAKELIDSVKSGTYK